MDILETVDEIDIFDGEIIEEPENEDDNFYSLDYVMSTEEAQEITDAIRSAATATFILLARAHEQQAHKALGYETWADYVKKEFDMSASRSYQLLDMNRVVQEIESVTPDGTSVCLTEAQARDIKRELPKITERIKEETHSLTPEEASEKAQRIIEEEREQKKLEDKAKKEREKELEEAREEARREALEEAADQFLAEHPEPSHNEEKTIDTMSLVTATHYNNLRQALEVFDTLPDPHDLYESLSEQSFKNITQLCFQAKTWLDSFLDN